jgi:hypothetical protein
MRMNTALVETVPRRPLLVTRHWDQNRAQNISEHCYKAQIKGGTDLIHWRTRRDFGEAKRSIIGVEGNPHMRLVSSKFQACP